MLQTDQRSSLDLHVAQTLSTDVPLLADLATVKRTNAVFSGLNVDASNHEQLGLVKRPIRGRDNEVAHFKESDIGVVDIKGVLTYEETGWSALCGMTSYEGIQAQSEYLIKEKKIKTLVLDINSGGGQAYGAFEASNYVRQLATDNGVKIITYVDGMAASGGYVWACIADEVVMNPMSKVGSIGVVVSLIDSSEKDRKDGIKRLWITAGKSKVPYDETGAYTKEAIAEIQESVEETYELFKSHVSEYRKIDIEAIETLGAKMYTNQKALKNGLADKVMSKEAFHKYLGIQAGKEDYSLRYEDKSKPTGENMSQDKVQEKVEDTTKVVNTEAQTETQPEAQTENIAQVVADKEKLQAEFDSFKLKSASDIQNLQTRIKELEDEKVEARHKARKEDISSLVSVDEVESLFSVMKDMDEVSYQALTKTLRVNQKAVEESMKEIGDDKGEQTKTETMQERMARKAAQA